MVILIVDDEYSVISSISNILLQNFDDCFEIHSAYCAQDAFDIARNTKIDLLITDIRMPDIDGIELADAVSEIYPYAGIIFVSAYDQKEYLKAAIRLNAIAYIDKPIVRAELVEVISKFIGERFNESKKLNAMYNDDKVKLLNLLISGRDNHSELRDYFYKIYNDTIEAYSFVVSIVKCDSRESNIDATNVINRHFKSFLTHSTKIIFDKKSDDMFIIITMSDESEALSDLSAKMFKELYHKLKEKAKIIMRVSSVQNSYKDVYNAYVGATVAVEKGFYNPKGISFADFMQSDISGEECNPFKILDEYTTIIRRGVKSDIAAFLERVYKSIKQKMDMPVGVAKFLFKQFIYATYISYSGIDAITSFDSFDEIENMDFMTFDDLYEFTLSKIIRSYDSVNSDRLVASVKTCIESSYTNPEFSVKDICDALHLSASHISARFKKAMGITLNNYITMVRLNHACALIKSGKFSSNEISFMVGYNDSNYFSRIFKSHFGMTVTEYRKENAK